jgi:hypothetical protein
MTCSLPRGRCSRGVVHWMVPFGILRTGGACCNGLLPVFLLGLLLERCIIGLLQHLFLDSQLLVEPVFGGIFHAHHLLQLLRDAWPVDEMILLTSMHIVGSPASLFHRDGHAALSHLE